MALTLVSGVRARASVESQREDTQYMEGIALLRRWRNPLSLFSMGLRNLQSDTVNYNWFEDELVPLTDAINDANATRNATSTSFVVDNGELFVAGDLWETVSQQASQNEVFLVKSVSTNTVTIERGIGNGGTGTATNANGGLADNGFLRRVGSAHPQGAPIPGIVTTQETRVENYCQDIRTSFGISEIARDTKMRGENEMPYQEKKRGIEHSEKIETAFFYGQKQQGTGAAPNDGKTLFDSGTGIVKGDAVTTGGINETVVDHNDTDLMFEQSAIVLNDFLDWLEPAFEKGGKESSKTKFFYCTPKFRSALDTWGISSLQTFAGQTLMGVKIERWTSSHGDVVFVTHSMLTPQATTLWYDNFLIDMEHVSFIHFGPNGQTRRRDLGVYNATGETLQKFEFQSIVGAMAKHGATHGRFRFKTYS